LLLNIFLDQYNFIFGILPWEFSSSVWHVIGLVQLIIDIDLYHNIVPSIKKY